ncbi:argininosuccinate lyase [Candidatus Karelsulcia muelleri]|uniref:Argininosuccinate lyase n=1 Tax=Candidatus Karelsulcia muelleri PSPU TaxID=1189303 RepID=A0AAD1EY84_9FLAO|nr:argininosuccinate lyase [Candidatus Karelsulcia muelleri]NJJ98765.1 argininosuccinate lyase [Candidatus Karelsulcia muelleri]BAO66417.1 argininosuccinate lyase [Candidatus Karelsulcia muelleri PSPU]
MKLWQKNFEINKKIEIFTVGKDRNLDLFLAPHDVIGTLAHIIMLETIGLLNINELNSLIKELHIIYDTIISGKFKIEDNVEDIHSQIELILTQRLGEIGKKIHSGRSRNDQILLDIKLFIRKEIQELVFLIKKLFNVLIYLSNRYKKILIPGYTHYQIAMPSSFGLWFASYAESLIDDICFLKNAYNISNKNPLGSAAGFGSSFSLNRKLTTDLLGFEDLNYNVVYAQMCRGKTERIVSQAISSLASTMSKISQDICLYMSQNFNFFSLPDNLTTGSSIMPHKKNPDVFELIRSRCNKIISLPNQISIIITNLSSGYHRDLQTIKEIFLPIFDEIKTIILISTFMFKKLIINKEILNDKKYKYLFSVEVVNSLVKKGVSFREAYKKIGLDIQKGCFYPITEIKHSHEGSISNLCNKKLSYIMKNSIKQFKFEIVNKAINKLLINI